MHGGEVTDAARLLDPVEIERLRGITGLAPLHMPGNLLSVELCRARFDAPQVACYMGLIALSEGECSEMQTLLASSREAARFAVDYLSQDSRRPRLHA